AFVCRAQAECRRQVRFEAFERSLQLVAQHEFALARKELAFAKRWKIGVERQPLGLSGALLELEARQARVQPSARVEARVRAFLDDSPLVHDDDSVGGADSREAMRD